MRTRAVLFITTMLLAGLNALAQPKVSQVYITGNFTVGSVLTGHCTTSGITNEDIAFVWCRVSPKGTLDSATTTHTILASELGRQIYLKVKILQNGNHALITSDSSATSMVIAANSAPLASGVSILGALNSGKTIYCTYSYSDLENDLQGTSVFRWEVADNDAGLNAEDIPLEAGFSYTIADMYIGKHLRVSVTPVASSGTLSGAEISGSWTTAAITNSPPATSKPTVTYSSLNVNGVLTGHYKYSDSEGDIESGTKLQWYSSPSFAGKFFPVPGDTIITHIIKINEQGRYFKFHVTPGAATGTHTGLRDSSNAVGPANSKPYTDNLTIFGSATINSTLKARYKYHDIDTDPEGISRFQWTRNGTAVTGETDSSYLLTVSDVDQNISFIVTPVSSSGYPDTGDPVICPSQVTVSDPSGSLPGATDLCIAGTRAAGQELTGRWNYVSNGYDQKNSKFLWYSGNTLVKSGTSDSDRKWVLTSGDLNKVIRFAVIPKNERDPAQVGDTVFSDEPLAMITLPSETVRRTDPPVVLSADPSGGLFNGTGVTNSVFYPNLVDYTKSPFIITYAVTLEKGSKTCIQNASTKITVTDVKMAFESVRDHYCQNEPPDMIFISNIPTNSTTKFSCTNPKAIVSSTFNTVYIDPSMMRAGNKMDTLFFVADSAGIKIPINRPFIIDSVPPLSIQNLKRDTSICSNVTPFELFVSQTGGHFEGPVVDGKLDPSDTLGNIVVKYSYKTKAGCADSVSVPIFINPAPDISFAPKDSCIESSTDKTVFNNETHCSDSIKTYLWEFYDAGKSFTDTVKYGGFLYTTEGIHKTALTATTKNNCTARKEIMFDLGVKPVADFYWERECYNKDVPDYLQLYDKTTGTTASRSWNFFGGDSLRTTLNPKYLKRDSGYIDIEYIVKTNYKRCEDTISRRLYIRPTISLAAKDYIQDFENGKTGWVKDYETVNNWSFGKPDRDSINSAFSGTRAWFTRYPLSDQKAESYSIVSPCFDFTSVARPMITMMLWKRFDLNRDGAALQYMVGDDPAGWQYVGTLDDGIKWYNSTLIKGKPGGSQVGWTADPNNKKDGLWVESRHKLDELEGKKDVKFRIVYGTDGTAQNNDGIAFDDIRIERRTRGVLLEHFTNNNSSDASIATRMVSDLASRDTVDVINIQYHTNFPSADGYYNENPADASARFLYYGLSRAPYSILDGGTGLKKKNYANVYDYLLADLNPNDVTRRTLLNPSFQISMNTDTSKGILNIKAIKVRALDAINAENVTLYLAVTEKTSRSHKGPLPADSVFYNVFRKFIPDAGGINLKKTWAKDDEEAVPDKSWKMEKIADNSDIEIIAFIQNNVTKEVYQGFSIRKQNIAVGINDLLITRRNAFTVYPNPVSDRFTINFGRILQTVNDIYIYDYKGTILRSYKAIPGQSEMTITDPGLRNGIYLIKMSSGGVERGYKKIVVSKNQ
jgi:hypothetical protein